MCMEANLCCLAHGLLSIKIIKSHEHINNKCWFVHKDKHMHTCVSYMRQSYDRKRMHPCGRWYELHTNMHTHVREHVLDVCSGVNLCDRWYNMENY